MTPRGGGEPRLPQTPEARSMLMTATLFYDEDVAYDGRTFAERLAQVEAEALPSVEQLTAAIASLAHGRCCWEPEQDARDILAALGRERGGL